MRLLFAFLLALVLTLSLILHGLYNNEDNIHVKAM